MANDEATRAAAPPILEAKNYGAVSVFTPENLLREARRQRGLPHGSVPAICVLDPDGDLTRRLRTEGRATRHMAWACYHTELLSFEEDGIEFGIVGCAVGSAFAVLVAEELFASGCQLLISVTSAGQLRPLRPPPYFILIDRALRDEGTSYHYCAPSEFSDADARLIASLDAVLASSGLPVARGATWTTDAPFRETAEAIEGMKAKGLLAVEMEAAALYAFAAARKRQVVCFAHVTNQMAQIEGDFEKGEADGAIDALRVIRVAAEAWMFPREGG